MRAAARARRFWAHAEPHPRCAHRGTHPAASPGALSFLATDVVVNGVRQWRLVEHDDFQNGAEGWSRQERSSCGHQDDMFLGGHCNFGSIDVTKLFAGLPEHSQVRVSARFHFIDAWKGEAVRDGRLRGGRSARG